MSVWAIADLHLSFGVPNKKMDIFGPQWVNHEKLIEERWRAHVKSEDLVLIAGDFSWAMDLKQVKPDLDWLETLPGTKLLVKGNHDYWWSAISKVREALPPSCHVIQNDAFTWNEVTIAGSRLWDTPEFDFSCLFEGENPENSPEEEKEKVFERELQRLEMSLRSLSPKAKHRIAMTHYPPISADLRESRASRLLEQFHVEICVFGHLHALEPGRPLFGKRNGIEYYLVATDYLNHTPLKIL